MQHRIIVHVSQAALFQITLATIAAYNGPRRSKGRTIRGHEAYGLLFGYVTTSAQSTAYILQHASVDPYARSGRDWVLGSEGYRQSATNTVDALFPWPSVCGCFHSHPYRDGERLPEVTGFSDEDRAYFENKLRTKTFPEKMRIYLVCSIHGQRGRRREQRRNQLQWSTGQHRLTLDAYYAADTGRPRDFQIVPRHREWPRVRADPPIPYPIVTLTCGGLPSST